MSAADAELTRRFVAGLERGNILAFIKAVADDPKLGNALGYIDKHPRAVADFARTNGYAFSAEELEAFVEARLAAGLTPRELAHRHQTLERLARGEIPPPVHSDVETRPALSVYDADDDFVLDRRRVLAGEVVVLRGCAAVEALAARLHDRLATFLEVDDLDGVHARLDDGTLRHRGHAAYDALIEDAGLPGLLADVVRALGLDPARVLSDWPGFRLLPPADSGRVGLYRGDIVGPLAPHRDTWFGAPRQQINFWGPIRPLPPDGTLRVLPRYFRRSVDNNTDGYDVWARYVRLATAARIREEVRTDDAVAPPLDVGDVMLFAGQHLHASGANLGGRTRVSFEFRLLHADDEDAPYLPTNVDYRGIGEIYKGWYDHTGREVWRLPPLAMDVPG